MYLLMVRASDAPTRLPVVLAEAFRVAEKQTDVSLASELEDRDWDAVVTCDYEPLQGDLSWSLDIYATEEVEHRPTEEELSSLVALRLSVPVFTSWDPRFPWIRRVALPNGGHTLARVLQAEDDSPAYVVDAAESEIPGFPDVPVVRFPEAVRAHKLDTPLTASVADAESGRDSSALVDLLGNWERLCSRMRSNWPPNRWFPANLYREDLEHRDLLEEVLDGTSPETATPARDALEQLDQIYRDHTVDDGGAALSSALPEGITELSSRPWYWRRRPHALPWSESAQQGAEQTDDEKRAP
ncbi:hypothetical protein ABT330_19850 [Streptomyces sp. NPDC000658]|uniref:hypothetical protein n=1 Tax=Streptomyces sp. NPDC000658 TaxID=3154266 RepID=UPI00332B8EA2